MEYANNETVLVVEDGGGDIDGGAIFNDGAVDNSCTAAVRTTQLSKRFTFSPIHQYLSNGTYQDLLYH